MLLVDKPAGVTSHDVVHRQRRRLGKGVKVGHAGTLDPFATGLLLVLVGRATRAQRFLMALPKTYETVARLGFVSSTGDVDGELAPGRVPASLELPTGLVVQRPPAYSAVKVAGRRAYALARAGEDVELPEREVEVYEASLLGSDGERASYRISCSAGTYIRSLVIGLGDAYCESLRRTAIGSFSVADASDEELVPLAAALSFIPEVRLADDVARRAGHGVAVPGAGEGVVRLTDAAGLVCLAEPRDGGLLKPIVGFRG